MSPKSLSAQLDRLKKQMAELCTVNEKLRAEVTDYRRSKLALLQSEQRLLALVNQVPVGIFATDALGECVYVNDRWSEIAGIEPAQALGKGWIDAIHPDDRAKVLAEWHAVARDRREFALEYRLRAPTGKECWVFGSAQANLTETDEIEGYFGSIVDITERKRYEEEIQRLNTDLEERVNQRTAQLSAVSRENDKKIKELSLLYRLSNTMLSTIQLNKLVHLILTALTSGGSPLFDRAMLFLINERAGVMQGMLGVTRDTSPGLTSSSEDMGNILASRWNLSEEEISQQRDSDFSRQVRASRLALNEMLNITSRAVLEKRLIYVPDVASEKRVDRKFARQFGITSFAAAPLIAKEQVTGVVVVDNALSARPISEDDLRFLQLFANQAGMAIENSILYNRIEDANRSLREAQDRLIQGERLASIGEMAAGIAHELKNPLVSIGGFARRLKKKLPPATSESESAETIVREVQRLEKMLVEILAYSRKATICYSHCEISEIIEDALTIVTPALDECRIKVIRNFPRRAYTFLGDCQQLKQVFLNLFFNAQEAMKNGGLLEVTIAAARLNHAKAVSVKVADSGGGIPTEVLHNIFNPFYTTKETGTGLGLAIANRIVTNHGGKIHVNNHAGVGVEFNVVLPLLP
jgi:PAS domain S-box-containing protein